MKDSRIAIRFTGILIGVFATLFFFTSSNALAGAKWYLNPDLVPNKVVATSVSRMENSCPAGMVWIEGGTFRMGSDNHFVEERSAESVTVDGFCIDTLKEAERIPGSLVFAMPSQDQNYIGYLRWWKWVSSIHSPNRLLSSQWVWLV